jgi:cyclophilin family peptidyl-prolyl cis-trans isomerase
VLARIQKTYPQDVRIIYRYFPLISIHDKAALAVQAAEAAGAQGKFWEMHDLLFERQPEWSNMSVDDFQTWLAERAGELSLDTDRFNTDLQSEANKAIAQAAWDYGVKINMLGTPYLLVNGVIFPDKVPMSFGNVSAIIALDILETRQFSACPPMSIDPSKQYVATLKTEKGDIVIELYPDKAPLAVNNFVFLARNGWYDGVTFHRVLPGFVAQSGDPSGTGFGSPGYAFANETTSALKYDKPGVVGMANSGKDSNGSQFFITYAPASQLDGDFTVFGQVVSGMDVATNLTPRDPSANLDLPPGDKIISVTIEEK